MPGRVLRFAGGRRLRLDRGALVMGILNCTPDSFFDGGRHASAAAAVEAGLRMQDAGAAIIDVGPQSTRPGAAPIPAPQQMKRAIPVIAGLRARSAVVISIDTDSSAVAAAALDAGADIVNDVSAMRACPDMARLVAARGAGLVLMHMQGTPRSMQRAPRYADVNTEVRGFLLARARAAAEAGVDPGRIFLDPGFGFGKRLEHNLALLAGLEDLAATGYPVLVGVSRKSMVGEVLGLEPDERLEGSLALAVLAVERGAKVLRVHDVAATVRALRMTEAVLATAGAPA